MVKHWKQNLQSCRGRVIGETCSLPYKKLENLEVPIKSLENEKKEITDWPRSLVWNQQLLAVYKFFQRNIWKSSLQHFYCVFLHQFCCQNDLMWAEHSLCLILSKFFDTRISKKRQLFSVRQLSLALWSTGAAAVMYNNADGFWNASGQGCASWDSGICLWLCHSNQRHSFPGLQLWLVRVAREILTLGHPRSHRL